MHNTIAIICDCDKTLAPDTTNFLLEENKIKPKKFWEDIDKNFVQKGWDPPQAYSDARKDLQKINVYTFILGILL